MSTRVIWIGNDVVDLQDSGLDRKLESRRFLERVFTSSERASIANAGESEVELWCLWACKEAAYKVASKVLPTPPAFIHPAFEVSWTKVLEKENPFIRAGSVLYQGGSIPVSVDLSKGVLHALAWVGDLTGTTEETPPAGLCRTLARLDEPRALWSATYPELIEEFTEEERTGVHSRESAAVRIGAKASIADVINVPSDRLQIVRPRGPAGLGHPLLLVDGKPCSIDISFSHHGCWIGWVFLEINEP